MTHVRTCLGMMMSVLVVATTAACSGSTATEPTGSPAAPEAAEPESGASAMKGLDRTGFDLVACDERPLTGLTPAQAVDYVALLQDGALAASLLAEDGTKCKTATDHAACVASLDVAPTAGWPMAGDGMIRVTEHLALTRGDAVSTVGDQEAMQAFLGAIDTPKEAALLVRVLGYDDKACRARVAGDGDGYEVITRTGGGCQDTTDRLVHVRADGSTQVTQSVVVTKFEGNCSN